jgi:hypothetical protein
MKYSLGGKIRSAVLGQPRPARPLINALKKHSLIFALPFFIICAGAGAARAQGNLHLGKLEIHPGLDLGYTYSDNINQESAAAQAVDRNPEESIIEVTPGLELRFPTSHHMFRLGYNLSVFDLLKRKEIDYKSSAMGSLEFNFPFGLVLRLNDNYAQRLFPTLQMPEQAGIVKYWENDSFAEIGYTLTQRWSVSGRYKNDMRRFQDLSLFDYDVSSWGAALFMRVENWLSLFGEAWYGHVGYQETAGQDNNADFVQGFLGLGGRYPKTNFTLKVGYENWAYRKSTGYPDTNELVASLEVEEKPITSLSISVNGSRSIHEYITENNPVYVSTGGGANLTWTMRKRLALGVDCGYYFLRYVNPNNAGVKLKSERFDLSPNVYVDITRWLRAQAGYTWRNMSSNLIDYRYKENRIHASLNAVL